MRKFITFFVFLIFLGSVVAAYYYLYLARVEVSVTPAATVQLDGGAGKEGSTVTFRTSPGKKTLSVSKQGFVKEQRKIDAKSRQVTKESFTLSPVPKISHVNDDKASWLTTTSEGKGLLYLAPKGKGQAFYKVSLDTGNKEQISTERLGGITEVKWSPDRSQVILKVKNDNNLKASGSILWKPDVPAGTTTNWLYDFRRYNFVSQESSQLALSYVNTKIGDLAWSPDGTEIAYVFSTGSGKRTLNIAKPDFSDFRTVTDIPNAGARLAWSPDRKTIALYYLSGSSLVSEKGSGQPQDTDLYLVDVVSRNLKKVSDGGKVGGASWSPDSSTLVYEQGDQHELKAYLTGQSKPRDLGVNSLITKATWLPQTKFLFVASPKDAGTLNKSENSRSTEDSTSQYSLLRLFPDDQRLTLTDFDAGITQVNDLTASTDGSALFFTSQSGIGKVALK